MSHVYSDTANPRIRIFQDPLASFRWFTAIFEDYNIFVYSIYYNTYMIFYTMISYDMINPRE